MRDIENLRSAGQFKSFTYFLDWIQNSYNSWSFSESPPSSLSQGNRTSISDDSLYSHFCEVASESEEVFSKFRSCRQYQEILEHVTYDLGKAYLAETLKNGFTIIEVIQLVEENIGRPPRFNYTGIGKVSPTQLRYAKVLGEIELIFGDLDGFNVVEIGVGYGGQASQMFLRHKLSTYTMIDLDPVVVLAKRFIKARLPIESNILDQEIGSAKVDLVISNYAFSELTREVQEEYFSKYIDTSKRGYVIFNQITPSAWNSWSSQEFLSRKSGSKILKEVPLTSERNVLIVWGDEK